MQREQKVGLVTLLVVFGFVAAVFFHYYYGQYKRRPFPRTTFLFHPSDGGNDFYHIHAPVRKLDPYSSPLSLYFPFAYVPMMVFAVFKARFAFFLFLLTYLGFSFFFVHKQLCFLPSLQRTLGAFALSIMTYPVLFCVDRGNLEALVFIFLGIFILSFGGGRETLAIIPLAAATAMKLYPGVFAVLYLAKRKYREFACTVALTIAITLISAAAYPGGVAGSFGKLKSYLTGFMGTMYGENGLRFSCSYFGALKVYLLSTFPDTPDALHRWAFTVRDHLMRPYFWGGVIIFSAWAFYVVRLETVLWKQLTILTFSMILLPQVSYDYKLIHVLIPLSLYLTAPPDPRRGRDLTYSLIFGLLLIPKAYAWFWEKNPNLNDISIAVVISPALMTAIIAVIMWDGLAKSYPKTSVAT